MSTKDRILKIVTQHDGIRASEIAKILKTTRKEVNHILYYELQQNCFIDEQYYWRIKEGLNSEKLEEYSSEELEDHLKSKGEILNDLLPQYKEKFDNFCKNILPTPSGRCFGSTSYDIYYIWNAIYTYELIKEILDGWENKKEDEIYYYTYWW